jgi:UMF1 family MFS transporter
MNKEKKAVWGWAMYDWANSAFATTVMAGFFPIFFKQYWSYGVDVNVSTAQLGFGNSLASLLVALMAPVLGAIADKGSARKKIPHIFCLPGCTHDSLPLSGRKRRMGLGHFCLCHGDRRILRCKCVL